MLSALCLWAAFVVPHLYGVIFVALIPLLAVITDLRPRQAFIVGFIGGAIFHALMNYWLVPTIIGLRERIGFGMSATVATASATFLLLACYQGLFSGLFAACLTWLRPSTALLSIIIAALWTLMEWFRGLGPFGYPWADLVYSQTGSLPLLQISEWTGGYGVGFLIAGVNGLIWTAIKLRSGRLVVTALILVGFWYGLGKVIMHQYRDAPDTLQVALVQSSISVDEKRDQKNLLRSVNTHEALSWQAERHGVEMIVWPESALFTRFNEDVDLQFTIGDLARELGVPLLIGALEGDRRGERLYNSCYVIDARGKWTVVHQKGRLVPFGEYIPFERYMTFLRPIARATAHVSHGRKLMESEVAGRSIGVIICFESMFPSIARRLTANGAQALVVITNDAWYGRTLAPHHHARMAVLRAVENRRSLARCANTGVTYFIDSLGRTGPALPLFTRGVVLGKIALTNSRTFYTRFGDWVVIVSGLLIAAIGANRCFVMWRRSWS